MGRRVQRAVMAMASALFVAALGPGRASAADCFGALRGPLERGGYGVRMDCKNIVQSIKYIGQTKAHHGHSYKVYLLSYRTTMPGVASHYGDRILIFDPHMRYLGHYHLDRGYRVRIVGSDALIDVPAKHGNRIHLGGPRPPDPEYLDQDLVGFAQ